MLCYDPCKWWDFERLGGNVFGLFRVESDEEQLDGDGLEYQGGLKDEKMMILKMILIGSVEFLYDFER